MRLKFLSFSNLTLLVALSLSSVAAWYSIIGLTAIFAGAVIPVIIMGGILEIGKITTTVWLRKYWHRCSWTLKLYLVPAVVALALLTSMGIFGFLSKAHMDQGITSGDSQAKLSLYDEKIKTQRDNIELARKALTQMDNQVDQRLSRGDSENSAERAVQIRRQQSGERSKLQKDIGEAQKEIAKLNEERAPIAAENRKIEAEVGPIKYIAALIYGDTADTNTLEAAVRWVIILLVIVFDPLAIALVLAANASREWDKEEEGDSPLGTEQPLIPTVTEPAYEPDDGPLTEEQIAQIKESVNEPINCYKCNTTLENAPGIGLFCPNKLCDVADGIKGEGISWRYVPPEVVEKSILEQHPYLEKPFVSFEATTPMVYKPEEVVVENKVQLPELGYCTKCNTRLLPTSEFSFLRIETPISNLDTFCPNMICAVKEQDTDREQFLTHPTIEGMLISINHVIDVIDTSISDLPAVEETVVEQPIVEDPHYHIIEPTKPYTETSGGYVIFNGGTYKLEALKGSHPEIFALTNTIRTGFGKRFDDNPKKGDIFARIDMMPNCVYKYDGKQWIEIDKEYSDTYLSNQAYVEYLIENINKGQYDVELLTSFEKECIENYLKESK